MATVLSLGQWAYNSLVRRNATQMATVQQGSDFVPTPDLYDLAEAYYANAAYDPNGRGSVLAARTGLPRTIRPVLALAKPAVDWWPGHVYPGTWTRDGLPTSGGRPNRLPFDPDTPEEVRLAVQQAFAWGNWGSEILVYVFLGALYGDAFVEVQVDSERQKVYPKVVNPRYVTAVTCNDSGDVVAYRIDLPQWDDDLKTTYWWGKVVTKETVTTLKDGQPFDYDGQGAEQPNPWGFAPAHWVMHRNVGGMHGAGALDGMHPMIDELCGLQSSADDFVHRFIRQHHLVASDNPTEFKDIVDAIQKLGTSEDAAAVNAERERIRLIPAPTNAKAFPLIANLGLGESAVHFDRIMASIERCWPEVVLSEKLLDMQQVTAPGAIPLVQDVQQKLDDACANYDLGVTKMGQMSVGILGEILKNPRRYGWDAIQADAQLDKFRPFGLDSFTNDETAFTLSPRELLPQTFAAKVAETVAAEKVQTVWGFRRIGLDDGDLYGRNDAGKPNTAPPDAGIIGAREQSASNLPDLLGRALNGA